MEEGAQCGHARDLSKRRTNAFGTPFNFDVATIVPGTGFSPAVITPSPNPIPPGGTGSLTTCYTGNKPPKCIQILLTNNARTKCCPLKLCPLWVECAQPETPDRCDLSSKIVADNASPVPTTAWIYNGSNFSEDAFTAERDGSILSLHIDPDALINNARPGRTNDDLHLPNSAKLPPLGTPVEITIRLSQQ